MIVKLEDVPEELRKKIISRFGLCCDVSKYKDEFTVIGEYQGQDGREHRVDYINGEGYEKY